MEHARFIPIVEAVEHINAFRQPLDRFGQIPLGSELAELVCRLGRGVFIVLCQVIVELRIRIERRRLSGNAFKIEFGPRFCVELDIGVFEIMVCNHRVRIDTAFKHRVRPGEEIQQHALRSLSSERTVVVSVEHVRPVAGVSISEKDARTVAVEIYFECARSILSDCEIIFAEEIHQSMNFDFYRTDADLVAEQQILVIQLVEELRKIHFLSRLHVVLEVDRLGAQFIAEPARNAHFAAEAIWKESGVQESVADRTKAFAKIEASIAVVAVAVVERSPEHRLALKRAGFAVSRFPFDPWSFDPGFQCFKVRVGTVHVVHGISHKAVCEISETVVRFRRDISAGILGPDILISLENFHIKVYGHIRNDRSVEVDARLGIKPGLICFDTFLCFVDKPLR
ncbi:MAG: hypothetical protein BWY39_00669 [Spirochaetes bacterium ADurb.Bin269]|nr:MAG: hypothetical protein BWY39_00669 [Spirochaetes bacterium ADurb.Bin269]